VIPPRRVVGLALLFFVLAPAGAQDSHESRPASAPAGSGSCVMCHGDPERFSSEAEKRYLVTEAAFLNDIHRQRGLKCADCHGGDPAEEEYAGAHSKQKGFVSGKDPKDVPDFCGKCHSNVEFMRKFSPSARVDQEAEYWTSGHGKKLKEGDQKVAICTSCHGSHRLSDARRGDVLEVPLRLEAHGRPRARRQADRA
jgi:hypothetical protein